MKEKIDLEELYYLLMSSWIYSIEKTRDELLGDNIAYTRRLGLNATNYIMDYLKTACNTDMCKETQTQDNLETMKYIIECLEDVGFIQKDTVSVSQSEGTLSLSMTKCRADACKQLINNGIIPKVCLRSIVLANFLESLTGEEFTYMLEADPQSQPKGSCTTYLGETVE
jgi:hypothetical protein